MIPQAAIQRVFCILRKNGTGTCFAIEVNNRQYLVTAKHIFEDKKDRKVIGVLEDGETINILKDGNWMPFQAHLIGHHPKVDISVFSINTIIVNPDYSINIAKAGDLFYSQDVYFLGFPYNIQNFNFSNINNGFPFPLVKHAIISAFMNNNGNDFYFLDGINNQGFSGGPVLFWKNAEQKAYVVGVISGYCSYKQPVLCENAMNTDFFIEENTGLIYCYPIKYAIDLIKNNPTGCIFK